MDPPTFVKVNRIRIKTYFLKIRISLQNYDKVRQKRIKVLSLF